MLPTPRSIRTSTALPVHPLFSLQGRRASPAREEDFLTLALTPVVRQRAATPGGGNIENCRVGRVVEGSGLQTSSPRTSGESLQGLQVTHRRSGVLLVRQAAEHVLEDQATTGGGWMPWGQEPMKGAAISEMPRGAASTLLSGDARMRQRPLHHGRGPAAMLGGTGGTETS